MSYGTFGPDNSPVYRREASPIYLAVLLLSELIVNTIASFFILVFLLYLARIEYAPVLALQVTFGFTCLVFALFEAATALCHAYIARDYQVDGEITLKRRSIEDTEAGMVPDCEK
ncbi:hypothetical protein C8F04DRAFT_1268797 [Mycena alexandri]|uniref:Uncharacterized protein n=1 Tax=Mycena alexandri TaxID=1745969 RepID=A0AAD6SGS4_9AGAR|nr:hypothetical protein C8F04DRAFT_1268797 [Mycena alexandri]